MFRIFFELFIVFFIPTLLYALFLIYQQRHPRAAKQVLHSRAIKIQFLFGLLFVILALLIPSLLQHKTSHFSRAILKDGKIIYENQE